MSWFSRSRSVPLSSALAAFARGFIFGLSFLPAPEHLPCVLHSSPRQGGIPGSGHSRAGSFSRAFSKACPLALPLSAASLVCTHRRNRSSPDWERTSLGGFHCCVCALSSCALHPRLWGAQTPLRPSEEKDEIVLKGCLLFVLRLCYVFDSSLHVVFQLFLFFSSTGAALRTELEVTEAIGVGRGCAAVVVLGCLKIQILQPGPYPLKILGTGRAVL